MDEKIKQVQEAAGALMAYAVDFRAKVLKDLGHRDPGKYLVDAITNTAIWDVEKSGAMLFALGDALQELGDEPLEVAMIVAEQEAP